VSGSRAYDLWWQFEAAVWRTSVDDLLLFGDVVRVGVCVMRLRLGFARSDVAGKPVHPEMGSFGGS
jgi:hypothetical protein